MKNRLAPWFAVALVAALNLPNISPAQQPAADLKNLEGYGRTPAQVRPGDWPQFGGTSLRNNTPHGKNIPSTWFVGDGSEESGDKIEMKNVKWSAQLGYYSTCSPVVANGRVFIGTNNGGGYLKRYPPDFDLGCLLCFDEQTGRFLWQHSNAKLPTGRVHDWPSEGPSSVPFVDGERLWYVSNRSEVVCLDVLGFDDGENDGPLVDEELAAKGEADVVWKFDLMGKFGTHPHERSTCSVTCAGEVLLVNTGNGVDQGHSNIPAPEAPSFVALDRRTGEVLWTDNSPGRNILHGQWSSPTFAVLGGKPQALLAGGDGWLYSFDPRGDGNGKPRLWWKFDGNAKSAVLVLGGRGTKNEIVGTPVVYDGKVYFAMGQDPEHGEGAGRLWCLDPTKRFDGGDVSAELVVDGNGQPLPHQRIAPPPGAKVVPNSQSAVVWWYETFHGNVGGALPFEEIMHRTCGSVAVKDDLLYVVDMSGLVHCVDAQSGMPHWTHDLFAAGYGWNYAPLIVDGKVFTGDEEGKITVFKHDRKKQVLNEIDMINSIYTTPIVAGDVLFIATRRHLYAIATDEPPKPAEQKKPPPR
jgi:outer membrane protein assembly factor BamB